MGMTKQVIDQLAAALDGRGRLQIEKQFLQGAQVFPGFLAKNLEYGVRLHALGSPLSILRSPLLALTS
jgi:hypothetical protein